MVTVKLTTPSPPQRSLTSTTTSGLIWGGTLTPKQFDLGGTHTGYHESRDGTLSPDTFVYGDYTYGVHGVSRAHNEGQLVLVLKDLPDSCCVEGLENADAHWTLNVGGYLYEFSEATKELFFGFHSGAYKWPNAPVLTVDDPVLVEITTTEDDLFPALSVRDETVMEVDGSPTTMTFTVNVNPAPAWPVRVHYKTEDVTATGGATCPASTTTDTNAVDYLSTVRRPHVRTGRDQQDGRGDGVRRQPRGQRRDVPPRSEEHAAARDVRTGQGARHDRPGKASITATRKRPAGRARSRTTSRRLSCRSPRMRTTWRKAPRRRSRCGAREMPKRP